MTGWTKISKWTPSATQQLGIVVRIISQGALLVLVLATAKYGMALIMCDLGILNSLGPLSCSFNNS
jgi:hypothetical protein